MGVADWNGDELCVGDRAKGFVDWRCNWGVAVGDVYGDGLPVACIIIDCLNGFVPVAIG
jgi:hypothetical protein